MNAERVESILKKFPGPVTIDTSPWRKLFVLFCGAILTAAGVWLVYVGKANWIIWLAMLGFGAGAVILIWSLLPGGRNLGNTVLDGDGFTGGSLMKTQKFRWAETSDFQVTMVVVPSWMVVFNNDQLNKSLIGKINRFICGYGGALSTVAALSADELALLMNRWRELALARSNTPQG